MLTTLPNRVSALFTDPIQAVFRDFDTEFSWSGNANGTALKKAAPLSMWSDRDAVFLEMDVPGITLADLDVSVENGKLTIRGQRKVAERPSEHLHEERFFGQFERTVMLNEWVDTGSIEANLKDGVLHLKLSKRPEAQRQKVAINYRGGSETPRIEAAN